MSRSDFQLFQQFGAFHTIIKYHYTNKYSNGEYLLRQDIPLNNNRLQDIFKSSKFHKNQQNSKKQILNIWYLLFALALVDSNISTQFWMPFSKESWTFLCFYCFHLNNAVQNESFMLFSQEMLQVRWNSKNIWSAWNTRE